MTAWDWLLVIALAPVALILGLVAVTLLLLPFVWLAGSWEHRKRRAWLEDMREDLTRD